MDRYVTYDKLSKKAQKKQNSIKRNAWSMNPVTHKVENRKVYSRKRKSLDRYDDYDRGFYTEL